MTYKLTRNKVTLWQVLFILLGTTWLFAPALNHVLSYRISLISQYETAGQPFAVLFRLGDLLAGLLVIAMAMYFLRRSTNRLVGYLLLLIGVGMAIDPIFITTCKMQGLQCVEYSSVPFILHATETVLTALCFFALSLYDGIKRKRLVSIVVIGFQMAYALMFISQYSSHHQLKTLTQYGYQLITIVWLAWYCRDMLLENNNPSVTIRRTLLVRYMVGIWAFINGIGAVILSLSHIHLLGRIRGLYFAGDSAWLAQHGVMVGIIMLYLSRHLVRGERRARQIFLTIVGIEVLKYSVITPQIGLLSLYAITFFALFVLSDHFDRGTITITWQIRLKDLYYMVAALLLVAILAFIIIDRDEQLSIVTTNFINHFFDYFLRTSMVHKVHLRSVLLADTTTVFLFTGVGSILWILFRPYKRPPASQQNIAKVRELLEHYSDSSEDYFKLWPDDKQYFWSTDQTGFVAYKVVGSVAFALADPIAEKSQQAVLIAQFKQWCRGGRLSACFLPIANSSLHLYEDLNSFQIGASALITSEVFLQDTATDKWWRWKRNRATKQGFVYKKHTAPHSNELLCELKIVSDAWLTIENHEERGFALGYFDEIYLRNCTIHTLEDQKGTIVAFANQVPIFHSNNMTTIDLLRYKPDASDAMPFLLFHTIKTTHGEGFEFFDLGFVPFAATKGPLLSIARTLSAERFSSQGLEQFKNKFDPIWQASYLAYDGDLGDLVAVGVHLEKAMKFRDTKAKT